MGVARRGDVWGLDFYPFKGIRVKIKIPHVNSRREAEQTEALIMRAIDLQDYTIMDGPTKAVLVQMCSQRGWELPQALGPISEAPIEPTAELSVWKAAELFMKYPETKAKGQRALTRYQISLAHLVEHFGKNTPLKTLWVPALKRYTSNVATKGRRQTP